MRPALLLLTAVLSAGFFSCSREKDAQQPVPTTPVHTETKDPYAGYITYTIQQGANYCDSNSYSIIDGEAAIDFSVVFDSSCIYTNVDPVNQMDINKLMGFSDCNTFHQVNSARFGWNWMEGNIYLYAYCYNNGERIYKTLATVPLNSPQHLRMYVEGEQYVFEVNGKRETMPRHCSSDRISGYRLLPYFGGDEVAPHAMKIRIKYQ